MLFHKRLENILKMANDENWIGIVPRVHMRVRVAISVLNKSHAKFWEASAEDLEKMLNEFPKIKAQFEAHDDTSLGFAIRTLRMQP